MLKINMMENWLAQRNINDCNDGSSYDGGGGDGGGVSISNHNAITAEEKKISKLSLQFIWTHAHAHA